MSGRTARRGLVDALTGLAFVIALFAVLGYTYGAPSTAPTLRLAGSRRPAGPLRTGQPQRNHRRATAQPAVATGTLNAGGEERR